MDVIWNAPKYSRFVSRGAACLFCAFFIATKQTAALVENPLSHFVTAEGRISYVYRMTIGLYSNVRGILSVSTVIII